jgi:hypothetical protein
MWTHAVLLNYAPHFRSIPYSRGGIVPDAGSISDGGDLGSGVRATFLPGRAYRTEWTLTEPSEL